MDKCKDKADIMWIYKGKSCFDLAAGWFRSTDNWATELTVMQKQMMLFRDINVAVCVFNFCWSTAM